MNEGFLKFKIRILKETLIKSLMLAISASLLAVGIPLLVLKIMKISIPFWIYIIIGLVVFLLSLGLSYLLKPNDKRIAKRIDNDLNMNQKVETMVEYKDKESFMLEIQRDDTNKLLLNRPKKDLRIRVNLLYPVIFLVALGLSITSFVLPVKADIKEPEEDKEFEDDPFLVQSLKDLIRYVNESNCNKDYKARAVERLNKLIDVVVEASVESTVKDAVNETIKGLYEDLSISNSNMLLVNLALNTATDAQTVHYANAIKELKSDNIDTLAVAIKNNLSIEADKVITMLEDTKYGLMDLPNASALKNSYSEDELFIATVNLGKTCYDIRITVDTADFDLEKSKSMIDKAAEECKKAINMQVCNNETAAYLELQLKILFPFIHDEEKPDTKPNETQVPTPDETTNTEKGDNEGGIGGGDIIYGSDDLIYDPVLDTYVRYGDVINVYQAQIEKDIAEGVLTEEMIEFYREYYKNLMTKDNQE